MGEPYEVAGTTYTPADVLNYDEVGYLALDPDTSGFTGSHHTLPVPSYAEVTSLETGRTVLVRLERRGPMTTNHLVALSPAAMAQLGGNVETPVRVRRVNPPEDHRAMLRSGEAAPLRMDTPASLLTVLQRRLPGSGAAILATNAEPPRELETVSVAASTATSPDPVQVEEPGQIESIAPLETPELASGPQLASTEAEITVASGDRSNEGAADATQPLTSGFVVQAAAFASVDNARRAANALGGEVSQSGRYHLVQTGPFATRGEAEASLANVRRAGYSDARILTSG
ncbi:SPOR domain-containing protein [Aurantiacibacter hainanensis]|uniref:SPOR domain-containing protein n=1 Tax=Aurantiacibacter hainanensis TaxID=3076114 RepID=UPI0030C6E7CB